MNKIQNSIHLNKIYKYSKQLSGLLPNCLLQDPHLH